MYKEQITRLFSNLEIKDYMEITRLQDYMIDGKYVFNQSVKNDKITFENIKKIATGRGNDYTTGCLLDYLYFKDNCKMIAIDLRKQQALDASVRAIQQINFTTNLDRAGKTRMFFILQEAKATILDFCKC